MATPYDVLAPVYDAISPGYEHTGWLSEIEHLAVQYGLSGRRVLDVACGTGNSFLPLLRRGYEVTACDASAAMVARARERAGSRARVVRADMRRLPTLGAFDLITCLDDAVNHLVEPEEVLAALRGMRRNLAPGGLIGFDVAMLPAYAEAGDQVLEDEDHLVVRRADKARIERSGGVAELVVEVFTRRSDGAWERSRSHQRHRHHPVAELIGLAARAGLCVVSVRGQHRGGRLVDTLDEARDRKAFLLLAHARDERS